ncbi:MAG: hypothetical protein JKY53_15120 [Flavobacteriales bacterium]|nr:hypothetical protein [Flavobacteriales bacterium]
MVYSDDWVDLDEPFEGTYPFAKRIWYMDEKGKHLLRAPFEVMQFTGLFDENGKECYDEDILGTNSITVNGKPYRQIVKHEAWTRGPIDDRDCTMDFCYGYIFDEDPESLEVIGNIHQHSHLL